MDSSEKPTEIAVTSDLLEAFREIQEKQEKELHGRLTVHRYEGRCRVQCGLKCHHMRYFDDVEKHVICDLPEDDPIHPQPKKGGAE